VRQNIRMGCVEVQWRYSEAGMKVPLEKSHYRPNRHHHHSLLLVLLQSRLLGTGVA
jgi:hypothetical protein